MVRSEPAVRATPGVYGPPEPMPVPSWSAPGPADPVAGRSVDGVDPPTVPMPVVARHGRAGWGRVAADRLVPAGWRGARLDPGRPGAVALALVAAAAAVAAAVGVWLDRPQTAPVPALPAAAVSGASASPAPSPPLVVSVSGKVRRPGLVTVPDGARVADVLDAAGGALPGTDLAGLNLARRAVDGEQVAVGVPPVPGTAPPDTGGPAPATAGPLDLNAATAEQLDGLPGVGPVTARKIVDWRVQHGRFTRVDQLREVPGIGERKLDQLRGLVQVR